MNDPKLNVDESKLNEFMGKALGDMGAAINSALILIGDRQTFIQGHGRRGTDDFARTREEDRHL